MSGTPVTPPAPIPAVTSAGALAGGAPEVTFETPPRVLALRVADTAAFAVLGFTTGALALRLPASLRPDVLSALDVVVVTAFVVGSVREHRRRERAARAVGVPLREWTRHAPLWRPSVSRPWGAFTGLLLVHSTLGPARSTFSVVLVSTIAVITALVLWLARRARGRDLAAARAAHPGAAVVPTVLVAIASVRLARWAVATAAVLPDDLGVRGALVADADGLVLRSAGRRARPLLRWGWDDVELDRGDHPDAPGAAVLVLTLLGPRPGGRAAGGRRYDVTLSVRTGWGPVTSDVVDGALAHLLSRRPSPAAAPAAPAGDAP